MPPVADQFLALRRMIGGIVCGKAVIDKIALETFSQIGRQSDMIGIISGIQMSDSYFSKLVSDPLARGRESAEILQEIPSNAWSDRLAAAVALRVKSAERLLV